MLCALSAVSRADAQDKNYVPRPKGELTFNKDVAPIVFQHCSACHRPGEVAPFSLLTHQDVKKRASLIADVTTSHFMPPWKAVEGHGEFLGTRGLTAEQIGIFKQWADEGAVEGKPGDLPPAPKFAVGWQLGKPDMIVTMPQPVEVPAEGRDVYRNFIVPVKVPAGKYVKAVEFRPSNRRVVHHAVLSVDKSGRARGLNGKDGKPGFNLVSITGMLLPGQLGIWVPGQDVRPLPKGMAYAWDNSADFVVQLHLHPVGKVETEQSTIGFYFTDETPKQTLNRIVLNQLRIDIPPGEKVYRTQDTRVLQADAEVHGLFPHMHLIGKDVKVTAELPDGTKKSLLWIKEWDFNWQNYYECKEPVKLPKGTKVIMECIHDNSADNPANPNQPPKRVVFGEQTSNEMSIVLLYVTSKGNLGLRPGLEGGSGPVDHLQQAKQAILLFDTDKNGKLSKAEIEKIPSAGTRDIDEMIRRFDRDGDGELNAEELAEAIRMLATENAGKGTKKK
jgi:hypothetical protein